jgi:AcrR family transcriptional regulator
VLAAAERVLAERGEQARLDDVAAAAGLTKSTVFRHWPSKQALVDEVRLRATERYRGWVEHACWSDGVGAGADPAPSELAGPTDPSRPTDAFAPVARAAVGFFGHSRQALFDPLVTRDAIDAGAPELDALARPIADCVVRSAPAQAGEATRALLDALVVGTLRGWLGTPGLTDLHLDGEALPAMLAALVEGGLAGVSDLPTTGRRPRRPTRRTESPPPSGRGAGAAGGSSAIRPKEAQLLEAAIEGFAADGYDAATLEDIAGRAGTTASAVFVYWPSKEELFLRVRAEITARVAARVLSATGDGTAEGWLRAAIRANIAAHYDHPEYQAILLPVASLPEAAELESVGWYRTIEQVRIVPELDDAGDLLPVVTAIGLTVIRMAVLTMHRRALHPELVGAVTEGYLMGGIGGLAASLGVRLDQQSVTIAPA